MKRYTAFLLVGLTLVACSGKGDWKTKEQREKEETAQEQETSSTEWEETSTSQRRQEKVVQNLNFSGKWKVSNSSDKLFIFQDTSGKVTASKYNYNGDLYYTAKGEAQGNTVVFKSKNLRGELSYKDGISKGVVFEQGVEKVMELSFQEQ